MKKALIILLACLFVQNIFAQTYAPNGMVVSSHHLASAVGVDIMRQGGNAIDASIATAFALAVTHPSAGNIGGGGFLVFMDTAGKVTTFDFREKAPIAATRDMYLKDDGTLNGDINHEGLLAVGVPGTVAGLYLAHQRYGRLPWKKLVQPAIDLAQKGFVMSYGLYADAKEVISENPGNDFLSAYFGHGEISITPPGKVWKQPALARTLKSIRDKGRDGFYKGAVAEEIERYMKDNGGIITKADLEAYQVIERAPIHGTYHGYEIYAMAPPSSGGVALVQMLNMMECADMEKLPFGSAAYVHVLAEVMRRAFADRAAYIGDPDFNANIPLEKLLSKSYAKSLYDHIDMTKASISDPSAFGQPYESDQTTHFSVLDKEGQAVSLTYTLEYSYGSRLGSEKLGFIFNNEMGDFNPMPGVTTTTGQIGTPANIVAPGKRMLSSMTPTIVAKDGRPVLVIGSPGGRTIINTVFQTVLSVLSYDMRIDQAIEAMKIHHQWLPNQIYYEKNLLSPDTQSILRGMGHQLREVGFLGSLMGITYDDKLKVYTGASDSSAPDGGAVGY